jgi:hypothetical protein
MEKVKQHEHPLRNMRDNESIIKLIALPYLRFVLLSLLAHLEK